MKKLIYFLIIISLAIPTVFAATPDGSTAAGDNMNIFITALFILTTLGLFYTLFLGLAKLATSSMTIYDIMISWGFYILLIMVNHLTAHYVEDVFMYNLTDTFLNTTVWTNGVLPVISFIVSYFIRATQKKRPLSVQEVAGGNYG
jgi:hypothetical protein